MCGKKYVGAQVTLLVWDKYDIDTGYRFNLLLKLKFLAFVT